MVPPLATALSPLSPLALLGAAGLLRLKEECEGLRLFVARACCVCRSLQAARLSALLLLLLFLLRFFLRSFSSLHSAGSLLADLDLVFVKSVLPECFDSSFSRLLSLSLLLLLLLLLLL